MWRFRPSSTRSRRRLAGHAGLGHHRLQHRVRLALGDCGPHRQAGWAAGGCSSQAWRCSRWARRCARWRRRCRLLIAGRLIQGIGAAAMVPSSVGLLLGAFPTERRSQVVALWGGVGALAVATGPSLGAALITVGGWRWAFLRQSPHRTGGLSWWAAGCWWSPGRRGTPGPSGLRRRGRVGRGPGRLGAGHLRGPGLGLGKRTHHRLLRDRALARRHLPVPLGAPSGAGAGPAPVLGPVFVRGQCRRRALRHGLLRHAPRQRPVS